MDDLLLNIASQLKNHLTDLRKDGYKYITVIDENKESIQDKQIVNTSVIEDKKDDVLQLFQSAQKSDSVPAEKLVSFNIDNSKNCSSCPLFSSKQKDMIYGYGALNAQVMFITETPEKNKNSERVFLSFKNKVLFSNILKVIGLNINDVYLTYLLKCSTPSNRNPNCDEVDKCKKILFHQIDTIQPKIICTLGSAATSLLLDNKDFISNLRGKTIDYRNSTIIPTFHPAYLLRSPQMKKYVWKDMLLIKKILSN